METFSNQHVMNVDKVIDDYYLDSKRLFLSLFGSLPNMSTCNNIDGNKASSQFLLEHKDKVEHIYRAAHYLRDKKTYATGRQIMVLKNNSLVEFGDGYCSFHFKAEQQEFVDQATVLVNKFGLRSRRLPLEINLIVRGYSGLELRAMEVKRNKLDLSLFYEDDFLKTDAIIRSRLNKKNDKGIVLLHGLPGTGKTSYLRFIIGKIKKKVLFLSPSAANDLMNPGFIELLIENPNCVVIIEDAENVIMDRKVNSSSAVSNLLNISDGLLADFLNVQLICTFNNSLTLIDSALTRKGRLIAKHEFGRLSIPKAQRLSNHLGFDSIINKPMTIAEIANQDEQEFSATTREAIGFRGQLIEN